MRALVPQEEKVTLKALKAEEPHIFELIGNLIDHSALETQMRSGDTNIAALANRVAELEADGIARDERIGQIQATLTEKMSTAIAAVQAQLALVEARHDEDLKAAQDKQVNTDAKLAAFDESTGRRLKKVQKLAEQCEHGQKVHAKQMQDLKHTVFTDMGDLRSRVQTIEVEGVKMAANSDDSSDFSDLSDDKASPISARHGSVIGISGELGLAGASFKEIGDDLKTFRDAFKEKSRTTEEKQPKALSRSKTSAPRPNEGSKQASSRGARGGIPEEADGDSPDDQRSIASAFGSRAASPSAVSPMSPLSPLSPGAAAMSPPSQVASSSEKPPRERPSEEEVARPSKEASARRDSDPYVGVIRPIVSRGTDGAVSNKRSSTDDMDVQQELTSLRQDPDMLTELGLAKGSKQQTSRNVAFQRGETRTQAGAGGRRGATKTQGGENAATPSMVDMIVTTKLTSYMKANVIDAKLKKLGHKVDAKVKKVEEKGTELAATVEEGLKDGQRALKQGLQNERTSESLKLDIEGLEGAVSQLKASKAPLQDIESLRQQLETKAEAKLVHHHRGLLEQLDERYKEKVQSLQEELAKYKKDIADLREANRHFASQSDLLQCRAIAEKALRPAGLEHLAVELGEVKAELDFRLRQLSLLVSKTIDKGQDGGGGGSGGVSSGSSSNQLSAMSVCLYGLAKLCLPVHSGSVSRKQRQHLSTQLLHTLDGVWRWISLQEQEDLQLDSLLTFILSSENSVYLGAEEAEEQDHAYARARKSILGDAQLGGHGGQRPRKSLAPHRARDRRSVASLHFGRDSHIGAASHSESQTTLMSTRSAPARQLLDETESAVRLPRISAQVVYVDDV